MCRRYSDKEGREWGGVMNGNLEVLKKRRLGRFEEDEIGECHSFEPRGLKEKDIGEI